MAVRVSVDRSINRGRVRKYFVPIRIQMLWHISR